MISSVSNITNVCGKYLIYPEENKIVDGGLRTLGKVKENKTHLPLVSIITVCLNSEKTIEQTILSILNQTYNNIEYIVIDGGSSDHTNEIIKKYFV